MKKKALDVLEGEPSYPHIQVSPRYHLVVDRHIEPCSDRKLFTQSMNSPQYLVRKGEFPDSPVQARVAKVLDQSKFQGRKDRTMEDLMRRTLHAEIRRSRGFSQKSIALTESDTKSQTFVSSARIRSMSLTQEFWSGFSPMSPKSATRDTSGVIMTIKDKTADAKLQHHQPVSLSWT